MKRLLTLLLICLLIWPAAALAQTTGIANLVPVLSVADSSGSVSALSDDDPSTVWYGTVDPSPDVPTWTIMVSSQTVREIWLRNGARQSPGDYLAAGRASQLAVTVYYANSQVVTYRYQLNDAYSADSSRDFVNGYQRLLLPTPLRGVYCIELRVLETVGAETIALTDILLSSGQPSQASSGIQMRPAAPTMRPASTTLAPVTTKPSASSPTETPKPQKPAAPGSTLPPAYSLGSGVTATLLRDIGVRTGPGTNYDYVGTYFRGGEQVQVISKVWDPVNTLYWLQVDFVAVGGYHYRGYCVREKRVDVDPNSVPDDPAGLSATVNERTNSYYGPGTDYRAHNDKISAGTRGTIYAEDNGFVLFEWKGKEEMRRAWVPESVVTWSGK